MGTCQPGLQGSCGIVKAVKSWSEMILEVSFQPKPFCGSKGQGLHHLSWLPSPTALWGARASLTGNKYTIPVKGAQGGTGHLELWTYPEPNHISGSQCLELIKKAVL